VGAFPRGHEGNCQSSEVGVAAESVQKIQPEEKIASGLRRK
jgi:hypothetical protein